MRFEPWVGSRWGQPDNRLAGAKLLILGESHYGSPADPTCVGTCDPDTTRQVVAKLALRERHPFFTKLTQVIDGRPRWEMSGDDVHAIWASVAFYNYVPVFVATETRVRPSDDMFRLGRAPFMEVVEELRPSAILVCGYALWNWVLWGLPGGFKGDPSATAMLRIGPALAARMMHPSAGFSWRRWRPVVEQLLASSASGPTKWPHALAADAASETAGG